MIWVIYRQKSTFGGPKAIPFENDSKDIANDWISEMKDKVEVIDIAISELGDINENS